MPLFQNQTGIMNFGFMNRQTTTAPAMNRAFGILPSAKALTLKSLSASSSVIGTETVITFVVENTSPFPKRYQATMENKKANGKTVTASTPKTFIKGKSTVTGTFKFTPTADDVGTDIITVKVFQAPPIIATFPMDQKSITLVTGGVIPNPQGQGDGSGTGVDTGEQSGLSQAVEIHASTPVITVVQNQPPASVNPSVITIVRP